MVCGTLSAIPREVVKLPAARTGQREELLMFPYVMPDPSKRERLLPADSDQVIYFRFHNVGAGWPWRCEICGNGCGFTVRPFAAQLWWHWWYFHGPNRRAISDALKRASA